MDITAAITEFRRESAALRRIEQRTGARVAAGNWAVSPRTRAAVARHRDALDAVRTRLELAGHSYLVATLVIEAQQRGNLAWARREGDVRAVAGITTSLTGETKRVRAYVQNHTPAPEPQAAPVRVPSSAERLAMAASGQYAPGVCPGDL